MNLEHTGARFHTTRWTLLDAARAGDPAMHAAALDELVRRYWPPIYAYLRRAGAPRAEAAETTQAFFADVVLQRRLFESADSHAGRLRSLLLTALKRFSIDQHRRRHARGGPTIPFDRLDHEESALSAAPPAASAEDAFDRRWALARLQEALARCEHHFRSAGRARHWRAFEARLLSPAISATPPPPLAELASALGFRTPADAAAAVQTVSKRLRALLRELAIETVN